MQKKGKVMKEIYEQANLEITKLSAEDVIATSSQNDEPLGWGNNSDPDGWT